jgi:hypothetical protein
MKCKKINAVILSFFISIIATTNTANAGLITETQIQTIDFQDFTFNFNVNDWVLGSDSSLLLEIKGDFSPVNYEYFTLLVEGLNYGHWTRDNSDSFTAFSSETATLTNKFTFNTSHTTTFLSDDVFSFNVNFSSEVHEFWGGHDGSAPYVKAIYSYKSVDVPEPSTLAIFALGMIGLASRRFKKQS